MIEFLTCYAKTFGCESTSSSGYRPACGFNVVDNVMLDRTVGSTGLSQSRKLEEKREIGVRRVLLS